MARIKLSPILTEASGSVGGITIQRNRFGTSLRQKPIPRNNHSPGQYAIRQKMSYLQKAWQDLTDAERLQWNRFLDFSGQSINSNRSVKLSGHALFLKYQMMRLNTGESIMSSIEYSPMPETPSLGNFEVIGSDFFSVLSSAIVAADLFYSLRVSSPRLPNKAFSAQGLRLMSFTYQNHSQAYLTTSYLAAFGAIPSVGDTIHYTLQFFSWKAPIVAGVQKGISVVTT